MASIPGGKKVLGIIGCQVLEDEIVHVVGNDRDLRRILVVETEVSKAVGEKIRKKNPKVEISNIEFEQLSGVDLQEGETAIIWVKPIGLHQSPSGLREEVYSNVKAMAPFCGSLIIFYGLCGNAFRGVEKVASELTIPVTILRDSIGMIVDDCIGTEIGGTEEYRAYLKSEVGGYPLNTMWAANWRNFMHEVQLLRDPNDVEDAKYVFQCMEYTRVVKLQTGLGDGNAYQKQIEEFAAAFGLRIEEVPCTLKVVEQSYLAAKSCLS